MNLNEIATLLNEIEKFASGNPNITGRVKRLRSIFKGASRDPRGNLLLPIKSDLKAEGVNVDTFAREIDLSVIPVDTLEGKKLAKTIEALLEYARTLED